MIFQEKRRVVLQSGFSGRPAIPTGKAGGLNRLHRGLVAAGVWRRTEIFSPVCPAACKRAGLLFCGVPFPTPFGPWRSAWPYDRSGRFLGEQPHRRGRGLLPAKKLHHQRCADGVNTWLRRCESSRVYIVDSSFSALWVVFYPDRRQNFRHIGKGIDPSARRGLAA